MTQNSSPKYHITSRLLTRSCHCRFTHDINVFCHVNLMREQLSKYFILHILHHFISMQMKVGDIVETVVMYMKSQFALHMTAAWWVQFILFYTIITICVWGNILPFLHTHPGSHIYIFKYLMSLPVTSTLLPFLLIQKEIKCRSCQYDRHPRSTLYIALLTSSHKPPHHLTPQLLLILYLLHLYFSACHP